MVIHFQVGLSDDLWSNQNSCPTSPIPTLGSTWFLDIFGIGCVGHGFWFEYRFAAAAAGVAGAHDDAEDDDDEDGEDASAAKIEHPTQGAL